MSYEIYNEDCLEGMKRLEDKSVDCVISDLPYNLTDCAWDKNVIDLATMWEQFKRILKPCCSVLLFGSSRFTFKLYNSNPEWYKYKWIWAKNRVTGFVHAKNRPMCRYEEILVFSNGTIVHKGKSPRRMKYFPQGLIKGGRSYRGRKAGNIYGDHNGSLSHTYTAEKPVPLLEYLIRTYTNAGEIVLEATMGGGSTGVACVNTNRRFIGFEIEKKFYDIAKRRIDKAIVQRVQSLFR